MRIHLALLLLIALLLPARVTSGSPREAAAPLATPDEGAGSPSPREKAEEEGSDEGADEEAGDDDEEGATPAWEVDRDHAFVWTYDGKRVGETKFRIADLSRAPRAGAGAARFLVETSFEYRRDTATHKMRRSLFYDPDWTLVQYHSETHLEHAPGVTSHLECQGWMEGDRLVWVAVNNRRETRRIRNELALTEKAVILLPHGVEIWAVLLAGRVRDGRIPPTRVAYPDFGQIYAVDFTREGRESVDLSGGASVPCTHFRFSSPTKQLHGEVWIDDGGRLLRYRQGPLVVQFVESAGKAPAGKTPDVPDPKPPK